MKYIQCQSGTYVFDGNQVRYELPLSKVHIHTYEEYSKATPIIPYAVPFTFESDFSSDLFRIYFEPDFDYVPLEQLRRETMSFPLNQVISELIFLGKYFAEQSQVYTIYEPINLFVGPSGEVKVLFRGVHGLFIDEEAISPFEGTKLLLLYLLSTASFGEIKVAGMEAWTKLHPSCASIGKKVLRATTWLELEAISFEQIDVPAMKEKGTSSHKQRKEPSRKKGWLSPKWIAISLGILAIATPFLLPSKKSINYADPAPIQTEKQQSPALIIGLRYAAVEKYQAAANEFKHVNFQLLSKEDKNVVLFTYLHTGQAQKALDLDPGFAENIVLYKEQIGRMGDLLSLKSDTPIIRFEQAVLLGNRQTLIQLQSLVPISIRRGKIIIRAMISQGQSSEVMPFAQKTGNQELITYARQKLGIQ